MAEFTCKLGTSSGQVIEKTFTAATEEDARRELEGQDYLIFSLRRKAAAAALLDFKNFRRKRIAAKEFLVFNQELASLITAGLPILSSLEILMERRKNPAFKAALVDIRDQVKSGASLSDAFASHGDLFPRIYASSLASGERSGEVAAVLKRYIVYSRTMLALRKKVVSALIYPAILCTMAMGLIVLLVTFILPKFEEFFSGMKADMPIITVVLLAVSKFVRGHMILFGLSLAAVIALVVMWRRSEKGAMSWDRYKLRLPLLGSITTKYAISRFCRTLGTLVQGGIPLVTALEISSRAVGNRIFESEMIKVAGKVREGQPLWQSLEATGLTTDMSISMIKVGESTGALEEMLTNVSSFYDEEIDTDLTTIVNLMEPALLIFMGLVVATMILAIYLPLIKASSAAAA
ncbi:MAG: type II secretion system F family protein [Candidatus Polarisedimenticolia bacterium]